MLWKRRPGRRGRSVLSCFLAVVLAVAVPLTAQAAATNTASGNWRSTKAAAKVGLRQKVPILLYHNIAQRETSPEIGTNTISLKQFEEEMELLVSLGCTTVTFDQMIAYVEKGTPLPKKPVCITFDDGYLSNYELALPVLKKHKMKATIFVIGSSVGSKQYYKDTNYPITPHFDFKQAKEMSDTGLISIQTHTYDMHQWAEYETGDRIRPNILPLPGESESEYVSALTDDFLRASSEIKSATGKAVNVLAYPNGLSEDLTQRVLESLGVKATLSIDSGKAVLIQGVSKSLRSMNRYYVMPNTKIDTFKTWVS